jgi:hypothetical protein
MARINEWSDEEVNLLRDLYVSNKTFDEIELEFPARTGNAIRLKASRLGLRRPLIPGNLIQARPLQFKSANGDEDGYLLRCKQCDTWVQVDEDIERRASILSCGKCGSMYQVLMEF